MGLLLLLLPAGTQAFLGRPPCPSSALRPAPAVVAATRRPISITTCSHRVGRQRQQQHGLPTTTTALAASSPKSPQQPEKKRGASGAAATEVGIFHPEHPYRDAFVKTAFSVAAALAFGLGVWHFKGADSGLEYYSG